MVVSVSERGLAEMRTEGAVMPSFVGFSLCLPPTFEMRVPDLDPSRSIFNSLLIQTQNSYETPPQQPNGIMALVSSPSCPLLDLPTEIRLRIYHLCLEDSLVTISEDYDNTLWPDWHSPYYDSSEPDSPQAVRYVVEDWDKCITGEHWHLESDEVLAYHDYRLTEEEDWQDIWTLFNGYCEPVVLDVRRARRSIMLLLVCKLITIEVIQIYHKMTELVIYEAYYPRIKDLPVQLQLLVTGKVQRLSLSSATCLDGWTLFDIRKMRALKEVRFLRIEPARSILKRPKSDIEDIVSYLTGSVDEIFIQEWKAAGLQKQRLREDFVLEHESAAVREELRRKNKARYWLFDLVYNSDTASRGFRVIVRSRCHLATPSPQRYPPISPVDDDGKSFTKALSTPPTTITYIDLEFDVDTGFVLQRKIWGSGGHLASEQLIRRHLIGEFIKAELYVPQRQPRDGGVGSESLTQPPRPGVMKLEPVLYETQRPRESEPYYRFNNVGDLNQMLIDENKMYAPWLEPDPDSESSVDVQEDAEEEVDESSSDDKRIDGVGDHPSDERPGEDLSTDVKADADSRKDN